MAQVLLVLPLGLPGSGKTLFLTAIFRKLRAGRKYIQNVVSEASETSQTIRSVNFLSTDQTGLVAEASSSLVRELSQDTTARIAQEGGRHVVLLDKNHTIKSIAKSRELFTVPNVHVRTIVLNFQSTNRMFTGNFPNNWHYPFPIEHFATCVKRVTARTDHPTLAFSDESASHVISVVLRHLSSHHGTPSAFRHFRGLRGFEVVGVPAISVPKALWRHFEGLSRAVEASDPSAVITLLGEISISPIPEDVVCQFVADFDRRVTAWTQPRRFPRYYGVNLGSDGDIFFRVLMETKFSADFTKIQLVPDPHVTLMYLNGARPESWTAFCKAEDLAFMEGTKVTLEIKRAVFVEFGLFCFDVDVSGLDHSLFPPHPHVTVCFANPFQARHSNDLLRLAKTANFSEFHGHTPNGSLYSATGSFNIEGTSFQRICLWENTRNSQKLNGVITAIH